MNSNWNVRKAEIKDIDGIHALIDMYADGGKVLRRDKADIKEYLANFVVAVDKKNKIFGCGAKRNFGDGLFEVRSLVVDPLKQGVGIGRAIVEWMIDDLDKNIPNWRLFTLTCEPVFFQHLGFTITDRQLFPEKIWSDCTKCPRNNNCNEIALEIKCDRN